MATEHRMDTLEARIAVLERRIDVLDTDRGRLASHSDGYRPRTARRPPATPTQPPLTRPAMTRWAEPARAAARRPAMAAKPAVTATAVLGAIAAKKERALLTAAAAVTLLYLASAVIVTPFQPGETTGLAIGELGVREQGQALPSALWAATGFAALLCGLIANLAQLRRGALALLLATVGKVFLYDLASLTSIYRVASFIVLGLLLLGAAFAWQRVRPQPIPDLRAMPAALR